MAPGQAGVVRRDPAGEDGRGRARKMRNHHNSNFSREDTVQMSKYVQYNPTRMKTVNEEAAENQTMENQSKASTDTPQRQPHA